MSEYTTIFTACLRGDSVRRAPHPPLFGPPPSTRSRRRHAPVPLRRAPFWTFARRSGTVSWEGGPAMAVAYRIPRTYSRRARAANRRPPHRSPGRGGRCCFRGCQSLPLLQRSPTDDSRANSNGNCIRRGQELVRKLLQEHHDQRSPGETAGPADRRLAVSSARSRACTKVITETTSGTMQVVRPGCARRHGLHPLDAALNLLPERYLFEMRRVTIATASRAPPRTPC